MSDCIVQNFHRKNLNILCNQTLKLFLQIHDTETMLDRFNYLWRLLHKTWPLWNFTQPLTVISFRCFSQLIGPIINILTIEEFQTSHSLIDVYREIIKLYTLYCNKEF